MIHIYLRFDRSRGIRKCVPEAGINPDNKVHGANMGPTWVLSVPGGPHNGPINLAIRESNGQVITPHSI